MNGLPQECPACGDAIDLADPENCRTESQWHGGQGNFDHIFHHCGLHLGVIKPEGFETWQEFSDAVTAERGSTERVT